MIKSRKVTKKEIEYYIVCQECGKEIKGSTEGQVNYNLDIHMASKHNKRWDYKKDEKYNK